MFGEGDQLKNHSYDATYKTSNDIIEGNGRILKVYKFIVRLNLFKKIYYVNIFYFFLLMYYIAIQ